MANDMKFVLTGVAELVRKMEYLGDALAAKYAAQAIRQGIDPMKEQAKATVRRRYGFLAKSIGVVIRKYRRQVSVAVLGARNQLVTITQKNGKTKRINPAKYAHLVEYGTQPHAIGKGSKLARSKGDLKYQRKGVQVGAMHPGAQPYAFLRPAFDAHKGDAIRIIADVLRDGLHKEALGVLA